MGEGRVLTRWASSPLQTEPGSGRPRSRSGLLLNPLLRTVLEAEQPMWETGVTCPYDQADRAPKYHLY